MYNGVRSFPIVICTVLRDRSLHRAACIQLFLKNTRGKSRSCDCASFKVYNSCSLIRLPDADFLLERKYWEMCPWWDRDDWLWLMRMSTSGMWKREQKETVTTFNKTNQRMQLRDRWNPVEWALWGRKGQRAALASTQASTNRWHTQLHPQALVCSSLVFFYRL